MKEHGLFLLYAVWNEGDNPEVVGAYDSVNAAEKKRDSIIDEVRNSWDGPVHDVDNFYIEDVTPLSMQ